MAADFNHFLSAQEHVYERALAELRAGHKRTHWMWFIFPQIRGLGRSEMAHRFAITGLRQAQEYLSHLVLGGRLRNATMAVLTHAPGAPHPVDLDTIFGFSDNLKFASSMTLFQMAAPEEALFASAIASFCGGKRDSETLRLLAAGNL